MTPMKVKNIKIPPCFLNEQYKYLISIFRFADHENYHRMRRTSSHCLHASFQSRYNVKRSHHGFDHHVIYISTRLHRG